MNDTPPAFEIADAIERARLHSPFLRRTIETCDDVLPAIERGDFAGALALARERDAARPVAVALRRQRAGLALALAIGDLAGALSLEQVTAALSDFADHALDRAITAAFAEREHDTPAGFTAIALGKHGSRELNYSSDIDPILIFDPETMPRRAREEPGEAAVRIGRRVVELLQERTGEGRVFRVDLRLRPASEVTPIVLPVDAATSWYEASAEPWERAAFIKARACAGDVELGRRFLDSVAPFVWRRALDFGAIAEIRGISRRIRDHFAQGQRFGPGYDLKRGRGGIREIEFFTQIHQLIHGGRDPGLRAPATLEALAALTRGGHVADDDSATLATAYRLHRTIEHRLQMVDDRQTHALPLDPAALDNVGRLHGLADGGALIGLLASPVEAVGAIYDALDASDAAEALPTDPALLEGALAAAGFDDLDNARRRIEGWRSRPPPTLRSPAARAAFDAVLPALVRAFGAAPNPMAAINRFDALLERLPSAVNLFRLLEARPAMAALLADILSHAPTLADALSRRAELLDGLIDATALDPPPPLDALIVSLSERARADDYQSRLDFVRRIVGEQRFALGVQLIEGRTDALEVARGYARVAEAALVVLANATIAVFEDAHGRVPENELVILGLGRLGGEALTHASDLDLVFLFTGDHRSESDGVRPLGATRYFNRLTQRVTAALSVRTAAGPLYDVDVRLRPSGAQGLLAVSFESFAQYHREQSWTWEHMALARARPVFGSPGACEALATMISQTLAKPRDTDALLADVRKMRADIAGHKPPVGPFDVKLVDGGLVDLEFCIHLVQLRDGVGNDPRLWIALDAQIAAGLVAPGLAAAHDLMTRMIVTLRLVAPDSADIAEPSRALVARACGLSDWPALVAEYDAARHIVRREWRRLAALGEGGEAR